MKILYLALLAVSIPTPVQAKVNPGVNPNSFRDTFKWYDPEFIRTQHISDRSYIRALIVVQAAKRASRARPS